jgi:hypothetical protein
MLTIHRFDTYPIPPVFALALSRPTRTNPGAGGLLAIGGIPDVPHEGVWATTSILPRVRGMFLFYSILVDGFIVTSQDASIELLTGRIHGRPRHVLEAGGVLGEEGEAVPVPEALPGLHPVTGSDPFVPTSLFESTPELPPDPEPKPQPQPVSGASPGNKIQMTIDSGATNMCVSALLPFSLPARQEKGMVSSSPLPFHPLNVY